MLAGFTAFTPVLEANETQTDILTLTDETEARNVEHFIHRRILQHDLFHLTQHHTGPLHIGPWR